MSLSNEHIQKHLFEWTEEYLDRNDSRGGGHAGLSLNIFCGLLREPPKRVAALALRLRYPEDYKNKKISAGIKRYFDPGL